MPNTLLTLASTSRMGGTTESLLAPALIKISKALVANARISGNAAVAAMFSTPGTKGDRYRAATSFSRTSLTKFPTTIHVIRWVSVDRSFRARIKSGTMTASVGALTSATKVVLDKVLIVLGTAAGEVIASTRGLMCLMISALGRIEQRVVAHLIAADET